MMFLPRLFLSLLLLTGGPSAWAQTEPYRLRHGDAVRVSVWKDEALNMEVRVLPDGSITFDCASEEGMVLSIGRRRDPVASLRVELDRARARLASPQAVIGFDCILRKLELEKLGLDDEAGALLADRRVETDREVGLRRARRRLEQLESAQEVDPRGVGRLVVAQRVDGLVDQRRAEAADLVEEGGHVHIVPDHTFEYS